MFNFERERSSNREVEKALQEVQDVLNLVDVLARATANFLNDVGDQDENCFSQNVSNWLFEKKQGRNSAPSRRRNKDSKDLRPNSADELDSIQWNRSAADLDLLRRREETESNARFSRSFSCTGSYADGQNISSSYYSSQLLSHSVSSNFSYVSPRSRYLEIQAAQLSRLRDRLSAINTTPRKSACELVGPIAVDPTSKTCQKRIGGVTVSLSGASGGHSDIRSAIAKSKGMFGDFASPSNPNYKTPWEMSTEGRARLMRNYYRR